MAELLKDHPEGGWYCPNQNCQEQTNKLIYSGKKIYCPQCFTYRSLTGGINLHQNVGDRETQITRGKMWEIDNRGVSRDDGRTVINRITGREAQR